MFVEHKEAGEASPNRENGDALAAGTKILLDAAAYIEKHGWCQGNYWRDGRSCAVGAIARVGRWGEQGAGHEARRMAYSKLERLTGQPIVHWNDAAGRSEAEVVYTLRKAALGS
jgi:hypothetical protein